MRGLLEMRWSEEGRKIATILVLLGLIAITGVIYVRLASLLSKSVATMADRLREKDKSIFRKVLWLGVALFAVGVVWGSVSPRNAPSSSAPAASKTLPTSSARGSNQIPSSSGKSQGSSRSGSRKSTLVTYSVLKVNDVSYANVPRYSLDVLVPVGVTKAQLQAVAADLVRKIRTGKLGSRETSFKALALELYDRPQEEKLGTGAELGYAQFGKGGKWSNASEAQGGCPGCSWTWYLNTNVFGPHAQARPTDREFQAYEIFTQYENSHASASDQQAVAYTAKQLGISQGTVMAYELQVLTYTH